jgi:hypothetical protein
VFQTISVYNITQLNICSVFVNLSVFLKYGSSKNDIKYMDLEITVYNRLKKMFDNLIKKYKKSLASV